MKPLNVLLVSYSFPPAGGTGVMRASSLARYLPGENIRLDVLTTRNASAVGSDPGLLKDIPAAVTIHRTVTLDLPFGIKKRIKQLVTRPQPQQTPASAQANNNPNLFKQAIQNILRPDPQVTWLPVLTRAARRIIRERNIDLVLITVPPFSSTLLVEKLRKDFPALPIVIDFRDEWLTTTFDLVSFLFNSGERARAFAQKTEAAAIENATAIVAVTEAARRQIRSRYPLESDSKFLLIPNGFDATRLRSSVRTQPRADGKIIVTYVGTVYASTEPTTLVQAIQSLPSEVKDKFILRFIGHIEEPSFREALLQLGEMTELLGYLPQQQALAAMNESDYVLLINHDPLNVGGKFYDYIGGGKPILGLVHMEGESRRLLERLRVGWFAGNRDLEGIRQLFIDAAARGNDLQTAFQPDVACIAQYERNALAQKYAKILHAIARPRPSPESTNHEPAQETR